MPARNRVDEAVAEFRQGLRLQLDSASSPRCSAPLCSRRATWTGPSPSTVTPYAWGRTTPALISTSGSALYVKGDLDGAIAEYREAVRLNPNDPNNHFLLGNALAKKPDLDACIAELRETVRLRPDFAASR